MPETLTGQIDQVAYHNAENGVAVLRVKVRGRRDLVTVVGNVTTVTAGEHLEANGQWRVDRQHGPQFQANGLKTSHPASAEGIERYLASGGIRSIGPPLAADHARSQRGKVGRPARRRVAPATAGRLSHAWRAGQSLSLP